MTIEMKAIRIDYRKLVTTCAYCPLPSTIVRITQTNTGDLMVSTLCDTHHLGEKQHAIDEGMVFMGETSMAGAYTDAVLIDPEAMKEAMREAVEHGDDAIAQMEEMAAADKTIVSLQESIDGARARLEEQE